MPDRPTPREQVVRDLAAACARREDERTALALSLARIDACAARIDVLLDQLTLVAGGCS